LLPPLLLLHGDADPVVSVRSARHTAAWWAQALGARASAPRMQQRGARRATRLTEFRARGQVEVALREIEGLGHAWSGGAACGLQRPDGTRRFGADLGVHGTAVRQHALSAGGSDKNLNKKCC
jgi:poly(3-hydroxybutyrate) depolymerase